MALVELNRVVFILCFLMLFTLTACGEDVTYTERDALLKQAFQEIDSPDEAMVIKGLRTIRKYPTHTGLMNTIRLWKKDVAGKYEKEILKTLKTHELFREDSALIQEIFDNNFHCDGPAREKERLKRLIRASKVEIKDRLTEKIDSCLKD